MATKTNSVLRLRINLQLIISTTEGKKKPLDSTETHVEIILFEISPKSREFHIRNTGFIHFFFFTVLCLARQTTDRDGK